MDAIGEESLDGGGDTVVGSAATFSEVFHPKGVSSGVFNKADVGFVSWFGGFAGYFDYLQTDGIEEVAA